MTTPHEQLRKLAEDAVLADTDSRLIAFQNKANPQTIIALLDEIEALRKDAERYSLIRRGQHWSVVDGIGNTLRAENLDEAIDRAMEGK